MKDDYYYNVMRHACPVYICVLGIKVLFGKLTFCRGQN